MFAQPWRQFLFVHLAGGDGEQGQRGMRFAADPLRSP
jgi:hypothetical protein